MTPETGDPWLEAGVFITQLATFYKMTDGLFLQVLLLLYSLNELGT
jgi:hypothetical protein